MPRRHPCAAIDRHIGQRLREARQLRRISQDGAGFSIGVTYAAIQHYENGTAGVSAARLASLAAIYQRPVAWFFEDAPVQLNAGVAQ